MNYEKQTFRIAVCDDDLAYAHSMENLIIQCCEKMKILYEVKIYCSGEELLNAAEETDLLFLDVEMNGIDGIQVKDELRQSDLVKKIVFVTNYAEYMQTAFGIKVIGFECKPVREEIIKKWISVAMEELGSGCLTVQTDGKEITISENKIYYLEAVKDYVRLHKMGNKNAILFASSMKQCEKTLTQELFIRVHKSYIVNMQFIKKINGNAILLYGYETPIPIGRTYKNLVRERYQTYLKLVMRRRA